MVDSQLGEPIKGGLDLNLKTEEMGVGGRKADANCREGKARGKCKEKGKGARVRGFRRNRYGGRGGDPTGPGSAKWKS